MLNFASAANRLEARSAENGLLYGISRAKQNGGHGDGDGDGQRAAKQRLREQNEIISYSHGAIMAAVFVLGFPMGAIAMPLFGNWIVHASWQMFSFVGMWAGFGLGYVFANRHNNVRFPIPKMLAQCFQMLKSEIG